MNTQRTAALVAQSSKTSCILSAISRLNALYLSGRFKVIKPTPPSMEKSIESMEKNYKIQVQ
jgi:hypothetical protein